jgi:TIR domain
MAALIYQFPCYSAAMNAPSPLIFLSHASVDEEIARSLKRHIETSFPGVSVFVSSDPEDLAPGDSWTEKVLEALEEASLVIVLTTQRGLTRKWVWFESGRAWHSQVTLIPCCIGKVRKNELPPPYSLLQSLNIDESDGLSILFKSIEDNLVHLANPPNIRAIVDELTRLDVRCEERERIYLMHRNCVQRSTAS